MRATILVFRTMHFAMTIKKNLGPTISTNCRTLSKIASSVGSLARPFSLSYLDVVEALFSKVMGDERSIGPDMDMKKIIAWKLRGGHILLQASVFMHILICIICQITPCFAKHCIFCEDQGDFIETRKTFPIDLADYLLFYISIKKKVNIMSNKSSFLYNRKI